MKVEQDGGHSGSGKMSDALDSSAEVYAFMAKVA